MCAAPENQHIPVDNGIYNDLDRILISQKMDYLHGMLHNTHSHQLLSIVPPVHHERVCQPAIAEEVTNGSRTKQ
jgi:hypothetical protein